MEHYVYKITNLINGKFYIGKHSTKDSKKKYYGSGKLIKKALQKYGKENFSIQIIKCFATEQEAYNFERQILTEYIDDPNCYNLVDGGRGFTVRSSKIALDIAKSKGLGNPFKTMDPIKHKEICSKGGTKGAETNKNNKTGMFAMTKQQRSTWSRSNNSGRVWITNGVENLRIKKTDNIPLGYYIGRSGIDMSYRKGFICWTDGKINVFAKERPSLEFSQGMMKDSVPTAKMPWWNDGTTNKRNVTCPGDGWTSGRLQWQSKQVECPHCNKIGGETAMKRHHFDHCKRKPK